MVDAPMTQPAESKPVAVPGPEDSSGFLCPGHLLPGLGGHKIGDFWQWAYSDLLSNRNRSVLAEYFVGVALGVVEKPRVEWDAVDLRYRGVNIEVKSSAHCQSWPQKKLSPILFSIRKAICWEAATGEYKGEPTRSSDVYIFCVHTEKQTARAKISVYDVGTWQFYIVPTKRLSEEFGEAKSLGISSVQRLADACTFGGIQAAVDSVLLANSAAERN
jgi:hypothetical protein